MKKIFLILCSFCALSSASAFLTHASYLLDIIGTTPNSAALEETKFDQQEFSRGELVVVKLRAPEHSRAYFSYSYALIRNEIPRPEKARERYFEVLSYKIGNELFSQSFPISSIGKLPFPLIVPLTPEEPVE